MPVSFSIQSIFSVHYCTDLKWLKNLQVTTSSTRVFESASEYPILLNIHKLGSVKNDPIRGKANSWLLLWSIDPCDPPSSRPTS